MFAVSTHWNDVFLAGIASIDQVDRTANDGANIGVPTNAGDGNSLGRSNLVAAIKKDIRSWCVSVRFRNIVVENQRPAISNDARAVGDRNLTIILADSNLNCNTCNC